MGFVLQSCGDEMDTWYIHGSCTCHWTLLLAMERVVLLCFELTLTSFFLIPFQNFSSHVKLWKSEGQAKIIFSLFKSPFQSVAHLNKHFLKCFWKTYFMWSKVKKNGFWIVLVFFSREFYFVVWNWERLFFLTKILFVFSHIEKKPSGKKNLKICGGFFHKGFVCLFFM